MKNIIMTILRKSLYEMSKKNHQKTPNGTFSIKLAIPLKPKQFNFSSTSRLLQSIKTNLTYFSLNPRVVLRIDLDYPSQSVIRAFFILFQSVLLPVRILQEQFVRWKHLLAFFVYNIDFICQHMYYTPFFIRTIL